MKVTIPLQTQSFFSRSRDLSILQEEYQKLFKSKCAHYGVQHPFELEDEQTQTFFAEISAEWKARKVELYKAEKIEADDV